MDIGPVRRRFTAEPLSSPVPGEQPVVEEPSALERAEMRRTGPAPHDVTTSTGTVPSP